MLEKESARMGESSGRERFRERQQRRIARRRAQILSAAAGLFSQQGYASTTIKEIAEVADMAEGTLYNYFKGKREILLAIARETKAPMAAALGEMGSLSGRESIVAMFERALDISERQLPFTQTLLNEAWLDDGILEEFVIARLTQIHSVLADYIRSQVEAGQFRPLDPSLAAQLVMGMFTGLILPALRGLAPLPSPGDRRILAERVVGMMLDGVLARKELPDLSS
jgi:AcrR family transcriptional regulator